MTSRWRLTRTVLHREADAILAAWPQAQLDLEAIGWPSSQPGDRVSGGGSELTSVEAAADRLLQGKERASRWLDDLYRVLAIFGVSRDVNLAKTQIHPAIDRWMEQVPRFGQWVPECIALMRRVDVLASQAKRWWPPVPRPGTVVDGVTVLARHSTIEECGMCGEPVWSGHDEHGNPLLRRDASGTPFHARCYYASWRARRAGTTVCKVEGCARPAHCRGMCRTHYARWRKTGVVGGGVGIPGGRA